MKKESEEQKARVAKRGMVIQKGVDVVGRIIYVNSDRTSETINKMTAKLVRSLIQDIAIQLHSGNLEYICEAKLAIRRVFYDAYESGDPDYSTEAREYIFSQITTILFNQVMEPTKEAMRKWDEKHPAKTETQ